MAEIYHIYDYKRVPGRLLGTLASGLGVESRTYQKIAGQRVPTSVLFEAMIVDELRRITYLLDGKKNRKQPKPISETLIDSGGEESDNLSFNTPEEYEAYMAALMGEINGEH